MYRVQENLDGVTNVYDSSTGSLVMVVAKWNKENRHLKPCETLSKADQKMVQFSTLNSKAINECRDKLLPVISLQNITVCKMMPGKPVNHIALQNVMDTCPVQVVTETAELMDISTVNDEYDCIDQDSFMKFFGLSPTREGIESVKNLEKYRQRLSVNPATYIRHDVCDVDLTSNLGTFLRNNSQITCTPSESSRTLITKYDAYCQATSRRMGNWDAFRKVNANYAVTYPMAKRQGGSHLYVFNRRQRLQQFRRLQTGLTKRSRWLVKWCKDCSVRLTRLTDSQIKNCCQNVQLEPSLIVSVNSDVLAIENMVTVENSFKFGEMDLCIDGTVVIEIDEFGSETVKVSQKPSKQINHQTGNPWLSPPKKVSILNPLPQYGGGRSIVRSKLVNNTFQGVLPDVTILPVPNIKQDGDVGNTKKPPLEIVMVRNISSNGNSSNGSDADPEIEFLGSVVKKEKKTFPVLHKLVSTSPKNGEQFTTSGYIHFDPLNFVRATYHDDSNKPSSLGTRARLPIKSSLTDRINILRKQPSRQENLLDQSVEAILKRNGQISISPYPRKPDVLCSPPRLEEYSPSPAEEYSPSPVQFHADREDCLTRWRRKEAELNLISSLVELGDKPEWLALTPSASDIERNCILKCHICHFEEQYDTNVIGRIYDHMSNHGDLSLASLVSHLEVRQGMDVVILQAFPLNVI